MADELSTRNCFPNSEMLPAFDAARDWLGALSKVLKKQRFSEKSLQCLLGLWICDRLLNSVKNSRHEIFARDLASQLEQPISLSLSSYDSKLLLLSLCIIRSCGYSAPVLEKHCRKMAVALIMNAGGRKHIGEAILLQRLGLWNDGVCSDVPAVLHSLSLKALHYDTSQIRNIITSIYVMTGFGTSECPWFPRKWLLSFIIKVLLIDTLNNYDLATGAMLVRAGIYLGLTNDRALRDAQSFLLIQQLPNGQFGQYHAQVGALQEAGLDECLDLYLPLTVSCVWALAELADPSFRVFLCRRLV